MSDLVVVDGFELDDLAAEMGAEKDGISGAYLPRLVTNRRLKDSNNRKLEQGKFYLTGQDVETFADSVKFRPLSHHYQYTQYDSDENKMVCQTRQVPNWKEELRDTRGTIRCGRPDSKIVNSMTKEERKKYKDIKNVRLIRGLVTYEGTTVSGDVVQHDNVPCVVKLSGQNNFQSTEKGVYSRFDSQVRERIPRGYELWNFELDITAEEHTSDDNQMFWHTMEWSFDPKAPLAVDQKVYDSIVFIAEMIRQENDAVDKAYFNSIKESADISGALNALGEDLDADFEDVA